MDPLELNDFVTFGTAAVITIILLRMTFQFLKSWQEKQYNGRNSNSRRVKESPIDYTVINNQLLRQMALQIEDMHETISVTKSFQRAFSSIAQSAADQTAILKELSQLNNKNLEILEYLARMTASIDKDRVRRKHLDAAVNQLEKHNGKD